MTREAELSAAHNRFWSDWKIQLWKVVALCNPDLLIFICRLLNIPHGLVLKIALPLSFVELLYWYWFCGQLMDHIIKTQELKEISREIWQELRKTTILDRFQRRFVSLYHTVNGGTHRLVKLARTFGVLGILGITSSPFPGERLLCVMICRFARLRFGLAALVIGNALHIVAANVLWALFLKILTMFWRILIRSL